MALPCPFFYHGHSNSDTNGHKIAIILQKSTHFKAFYHRELICVRIEKRLIADLHANFLGNRKEFADL
jgi:hypothetical protein